VLFKARWDFHSSQKLQLPSMKWLLDGCMCLPATVLSVLAACVVRNLCGADLLLAAGWPLLCGPGGLSAGCCSGTLRAAPAPSAMMR